MERRSDELAATAVAADLTRRIMRREVWPGSPLRELELASHYEAGRYTIKAALQRLERDGLVVHHANRGSFVRQHSVQDIRDLYQVREVLEVGAIRSSEVGGSELDPLRRLVTELEESERAELRRPAVPGAGLTPSLELDLAFHESIVKLAGNPRLEQLYASLTVELRFTFAVLRVADTIVPGEHSAILDRLEAGDTRRAADLLTRHLRAARDTCVAALS